MAGRPAILSMGRVVSGSHEICALKGFGKAFVMKARCREDAAKMANQTFTSQPGNMHA